MCASPEPSVISSVCQQVTSGACRQEERTVLAGPKADSEAFYASIQRLDAVIAYFTAHRCGC